MSAQKPIRRNAQTAPMSLTEQLLGVTRRPVDVRARQRAAWHWLDWIACVAAGTRAPVSQALLRWRPPGSAGGAARWPALAGTVGSDMQAVYLDAGLANVQEMDDMHREAILHPGPVVLPAVAHVARHQDGLDTTRILDAVVRGYEAVVRVGIALGPAHYALWHNTATAGVFGAATAVSDLLGLDDSQSVWALGNAGTQAAGLWQVRLEPVMSKQLHTGHAAWAGLSAASLAQAGFTGPRCILEGEKGFFAAMCPDARPQRLLAPATDWMIHGTSFKPWPACRHTHATIDCVLALREQLGGGPLAFTDLTVESFGDAIRICNQPAPRTQTEAKFSLQYAVAATARWGRLLPEHFDPDAVRDPGLLAAAARVQLAVDPDLDQAYPARYGARVTLRQADGRRHCVQVTDSLGDPERPMQAQDLLEKARNLLRYGGVAQARMQGVLDAACALQQQIADEPDAPFPRALLDPLF
ncbi:MAG: MmgE/PrpD family protein [Rhodoferax sp.]|nr:MmgE/PrpD family protein [Rhodoferax sp.]